MHDKAANGLFLTPYFVNKRYTPGVNFTNILQAAFTRADPKSAKKLLNLTVFFALSGSAGVKAARRTLVKLTPGHVMNVKHAGWPGSVKCDNLDSEKQVSRHGT